jgi:hypothetical protein
MKKFLIVSVMFLGLNLVYASQVQPVNALPTKCLQVAFQLICKGVFNFEPKQELEI